MAAEEITERAKEVAEGGDGKGDWRYEDDLLIAVVVLGVIVLVLLVIIVCGWWKFVKGRRMDEEGESRGRERSSNMRESVAEAEEPPRDVGQQEEVPEVKQLSVPVKMRKRSMTFTETDEECRKYREDLAESGEKAETGEESGRFRKKSVVTFVGVEEMDANGL